MRTKFQIDNPIAESIREAYKNRGTITDLMAILDRYVQDKMRANPIQNDSDNNYENQYDKAFDYYSDEAVLLAAEALKDILSEETETREAMYYAGIESYADQEQDDDKDQIENS